MDIREAVESRRSVRSYLSDPVQPGLIEEIFDLARKAPSAKNLQPWRFVIVTHPETKQKLVRACRSQSFIAEAPVIIAGCADEMKSYPNIGRYTRSFAMDLAIIFDHLTLIARGKGLGTCWIGAFNEEEVKIILNIPENIRVVALTPLGYPRHWPPPQDRRKTEEIISFDRWTDD